MANMYNQWVSTAPVQLPIDTYMKAGAYMEARSEKYAQDIQTLGTAFGSVDPFSPNAQSSYDKAMNQIKTKSGELSKMNLKSPEAYRKFMQIATDPTTGKKIMDVHRDSLYGQKGLSEIKEYLKKNPEINAAPLLEVYNRARAEDGNGEFDPNRFKSLPQLTEYYDINKRLEEGIAKIHPDSEEYKKIAGKLTVEEKEKGVGVAKIRAYVTSQLSRDPLVMAQVKSNILYKGYKMNPLDIKDGVEKLGDAYRNSLLTMESTLNAELEALRGNMSEKELDTLRKKTPGFAATEIDLVTGIESLNKYKDPDTKEFYENNSLISKMERDDLITGFDWLSWREHSESEEYNPLYLLEYGARLKYKYAKMLKDYDNAQFLNGINAYRVDNSTREQNEPSPAQRGQLIRRDPTLRNVVLDEHGRFNPGVVSSLFIKVGDKYYAPEDAIEVNVNDLSKPTKEQLDGFELKWSSKPSLQGGNSSRVIYTRKGAVGYNSNNDVKLKEQGIKELTQWWKNNSTDGGAGANGGKAFDFTNEVDVQKAIDKIIDAQTMAESAYFPIITDPVSGTHNRKAGVLANLSSNTTYKLKNGVKVPVRDAATLDKIRAHLKEPNTTLPGQAVSKEGKAFDNVTIGNEAYFIEASPLTQLLARPANRITNEMMKLGPAVRKVDGDLFMKFIGSDGQYQIGMIEGGGTKDAQTYYEGIYNGYVSALEKKGFTKANAELALNSVMDSKTLTKIDSKGRAVLAPPVIGGLTITKPIGKWHDGTFYSWGSIGGYKLNSPEELFDNAMKGIQSPYNPQRQFESFEIRNSKSRQSSLDWD